MTDYKNIAFCGLVLLFCGVLTTEGYSVDKTRQTSLVRDLRKPAKVVPATLLDAATLPAVTVVDNMKNAATLPAETVVDTRKNKMSRSAFLGTVSAMVALTTTLPLQDEEDDALQTLSDREATRFENTLLTSQTTSTLPLPTEDKTNWQDPAAEFVAGAALAATRTAVKYPLDTATVRLQMPGTEYSTDDLVSLFDGCLRGISLPLLLAPPSGAAFFLCKDLTRSFLDDFAATAGYNRFIKTTIAVLIASFPHWFLRNPSEVIKTRLQAGVEGYEDVSAWDAVAQGDLYAGFAENILWSVPADIIKFVFYELLSGGRHDLSTVEAALAGALSVALAQLLTTPLDVIRNRVMAAGSVSDGDEKPNVMVAYLDSLRQIAKEEGLQGLFAGWSPSVSKATLSGGIQFACYEKTKQFMTTLFLQI